MLVALDVVVNKLHIVYTYIYITYTLLLSVYQSKGYKAKVPKNIINAFAIFL